MSNDLMAKLAISKKIMDKHQEISRGNSNGNVNYNAPMVENYEAVPATYNIPQEYASETSLSEVRQPELPTQDRILNSKLPDEIKQLMIENPIAQASLPGTTNILSNEIIEGAQRLMGQPTKNVINESPKNSLPTVNNTELKNMIRDVVRDTVRDVVKEELQKVGMISEGETSNETLQLRVGSHIFEGRVTKIKKIK